eukprot:scaffold4380_cov53-Cyclotella_meneghiniana.AAC.5
MLSGCYATHQQPLKLNHTATNRWLSGLPSLKQGMDLRPQEAAQEALTFDIFMIPFEAALHRTQFNTTAIVVVPPHNHRGIDTMVRSRPPVQMALYHLPLIRCNLPIVYRQRLYDSIPAICPLFSESSPRTIFS